MHGDIRVADFGLTEDMYGINYYRRRKSQAGSEDKLPIRWMAPESIDSDIYTEKTDVVSSLTCQQMRIIIMHMDEAPNMCTFSMQQSLYYYESVQKW